MTKLALYRWSIYIRDNGAIKVVFLGLFHPIFVLKISSSDLGTWTLMLLLTGIVVAHTAAFH